NHVNTYAIRNTKLLSGIEDSHHGPIDAMQNPSPATQEHQSDTKVFTMTMEILSEPTSNKLCGSDEVLKLKNFKKDGYSIFQDQEKYEHVGPKVTSIQDGKRSQDDD
ncbi:hypothetical protein Tco_1543068, partial [Tanacetum coccineum]